MSSYTVDLNVGDVNLRLPETVTGPIKDIPLLGKQLATLTGLVARLKHDVTSGYLEKQDKYKQNLSDVYSIVKDLGDDLKTLQAEVALLGQQLAQQNSTKRKPPSGKRKTPSGKHGPPAPKKKRKIVETSSSTSDNL